MNNESSLISFAWLDGRETEMDFFFFTQIIAHQSYQDESMRRGEIRILAWNDDYLDEDEYRDEFD